MSFGRDVFSFSGSFCFARNLVKNAFEYLFDLIAAYVYKLLYICVRFRFTTVPTAAAIWIQGASAAMWRRHNRDVWLEELPLLVASRAARSFGLVP